MDGRWAAMDITPRSSSAVLVTVGGPPESARLLDRRRIEHKLATVAALIAVSASGWRRSGGGWNEEPDG